MESLVAKRIIVVLSRGTNNFSKLQLNHLGTKIPMVTSISPLLATISKVNSLWSKCLENVIFLFWIGWSHFPNSGLFVYYSFFRLDTIMDSDRVLVMDRGTVIEFDSPQVLLGSKHSFFYRLVHSSKSKQSWQPLYHNRNFFICGQHRK